MTETPAPVSPTLWRHRGFLGLWSAVTVSEFGAQFSSLALPVVAVLVLKADEWQLGVLSAASTAAFLVVGLPSGAWVDRWLKRRVMVTADLVRLVAIGTIPLLWWLGALQIWHLVVVAVVIGIATVFFDVAYQSYIPLLVARDRIGDANAKLETSSQVARIGGPALAGVLLTVISAPVLLIADAISYLVSALFLSRVRDTEVAADPAARRPLVTEIAEGVRFVAHQRLIRRVVGTTASANLFGTMTFTLAPLLVLRELGLGAAGLGLVLSLGAVGGLLGAMLTPRLARWIGEGRVISAAAVLSALFLGLIPAAAIAPRPLALPLLVAAQFGQSFMVLVYNITQVTLRQRLCPPQLLGRMNASIRTVVWGVMPIASLLAGGIGTWLGVVPTMWLAAAGALLGCAFVVFSPLTTMRTLPD